MNNTRNLLLVSVAAGALIVGANAVFAQAPSPAPPAQQKAPAEKIAPALEPSKGAPAAGKQSGQAGDKKGGKAAQDNNKDGMKSKATASEAMAPPAPGKTGSDMKADGKAKADMKTDTTTKPDMKSDSKSSEKAGDAKAATDTKVETKPTTTGQGAAGPAASLSTEQRSQIRTSITGQQRATNVNFSISIGAQVPRSSVRFYPVSRQLVQIYPSWSGFDYFLVGDQIIVVNPRTLEIVAVLDA
jgi:hypothetical protein